jgi:Leucine-rich repeat (LRR) protein
MNSVINYPSSPIRRKSIWLIALLLNLCHHLAGAQVELIVRNPDIPVLPAEQRSSVKKSQPVTSTATASSFSTLSSPLLAEDSLILVELYNSTNGTQWTNKTNWLTGRVSTWYGISVSNGRVTSILLNNNKLSGTLPASIGNLSALTRLHLYVNSLTGGIPSSLGNIATLTQLWLHDNPLGGEIPSSLGNLTALTHLYIHRTNLTGSIPASLGNLSSIQVLTIYLNGLTGNLEWIGNLTNLTQLWAYGLPNLKCEIPASIGNLTKLTHLYIHRNNLTGRIPASLGNLSSLQILTIAGNDLTGNLEWIGNLTNLTQLWVYDIPNLQCEIPASIGNLTKLTQCYIYNIGLSGELPSTIGNLTNLTHFYIHFNYGITGSVPSWISRLTKMQVLSLGDTDLGGSLPSDIGNLTAMTELYIQRCRISGNLPTSLRSSVNLSVVDLKYINLTALPSFLTGFSKMKLVIANNNLLTEILNFTTHANRANLVYNVENNKLDFGDLEPHFTGPGAHPYKTFTYSPQADIDTAKTVYWKAGTSNSLQITTPGARNIYQWQKKDAASAWQDLAGQTTSQLQIASAVLADSGLYRLKITNQYATALTLYSQPITVKITAVAVLPPAAQDQRICANQSATLTATGTGAIQWHDVPSGGTLLAQGNTFTTPVLQSNKTYYVSQDVGGTISDRKPVVVTVDPLPTLMASAGLSVCAGGSILISVSGNALSYQWDNGLGQEQSYLVTPVATTIYRATGTGANGCQASINIVVSVNPLPNATVSPSVTALCAGSSTTLMASGGISYQWAHGPSTRSIQVRPEAATTYTVIVTDGYGCSKSAQGTVTVDTQCPASPEELRAVALTTSQISLTWANVAVSYTGLRLERRTETGSYQLVASLAAGTTSFTNTGLQPNTVYYYRIKSINGITESLPSNEEMESTFSTDQHFVKTTEVLKNNVTDPAQVPGLPVGERIHSWSYLDGELRPLQQVGQQTSPSQKDVVQPYEYDALGRQAFAHLPYTVSATAPGSLRTNALGATGEQRSFYNGVSTPPTVAQESVNPYSQTAFENSPLSRPTEASSPGQAWLMANGKTVKTTNGVNVVQEVLQWGLVNGLPQADRYYEAGELKKTTLTNEEGIESVDFTDKTGRLIMRKMPSNVTIAFVYDKNNNLVYVITPLAMANALAQELFPRTLSQSTLVSCQFNIVV